MKCPICGNENLSEVIYTHTVYDKEKGGFNKSDAICGILALGWPGLLCGLCDTDQKESETRTYTRTGYVCNNCGAKLKKKKQSL